MKRKKNEETLCELWETIKRNDPCITGVSEEEREKGAES